MARTHFVKSARKDNPVCKKGESYYWWKPAFGAKRYSLTAPRPSQKASGRKASVMAAQEELQDALNGAKTIEEVQEACETCAETFRELGDEYEESADNMPESLQYGDQAESMREMGDSLRTQGDELESLDFDGPDEFDDPEPDEDDFDDVEDYEYAMEEWEAAKCEAEEELEDFLENLKSEAIDISESVEFMF